MERIAFALLLVLLFASACVPSGNQSAQPISTPTYLTPGTSTPETLPPTPEPATAIPLNPDIKAALGNADYTVAPDGNAVITLKDANQKVEIIKAADVKTNDGLAKDIKTGYDKDNNRFIFVENYGWIKDIDPGTPEKRTQVPYEWFGNGAVNTIAALHYQDHPTIPPGAIDPQWWVRGDGSKEAGGYIGVLTLIPIDYAYYHKNALFTKNTKPYGSITLWLQFSVGGKSFVTAVQPNKNPDKVNGKPDQKINLPLTFDADRFDDKNKNVDNIPDALTSDAFSFQALLTPDSSQSSGQSFFNAFANLRGPDNVFSTPTLQSPGEQINLFPPNVQQTIMNIWAKEAKITWGNIPPHESQFRLITLPSKLALKNLTADYTTYPWGDIKP